MILEFLASIPMTTLLVKSYTLALCDHDNYISKSYCKVILAMALFHKLLSNFSKSKHLNRPITLPPKFLLADILTIL